MTPAERMPDRFVRFRKNAAKPTSTSLCLEGFAMTSRCRSHVAMVTGVLRIIAINSADRDVAALQKE